MMTRSSQACRLMLSIGVLLLILIQISPILQRLGSRFQPQMVPHSRTIELRWTDLQVPSWIPFSIRTSIFNPSIVRHNGELWLYARYCGDRLENESDLLCYKHKPNEPFVCPVDNMRIVSFIVRCPISLGLESCRAPLEGLPYPLRWDLAEAYANVRILGPEDARFISNGNQLFAVFNGPPQGKVAKGGALDRYMATLEDIWRAPRGMKMAQMALNASFDPIELSLEGKEMSFIEKNWAPMMFRSPDVLRLSRFLEPHEVVDCNITSGQCLTVAMTSFSSFFRPHMAKYGYQRLHLGSNYIRADDRYYMAIAHAIMPNSPDYRRNYAALVYLVTADAPHRVVAVSNDPIQLPQRRVKGFVYVSSLFREGDTVVIGYNVNDETASLAWTTIDALTRMVSYTPHCGFDSDRQP
eukprot:TRINITY_DN9555_c0_g2_i3.p1 TRINITY_DN9555_c0_g2~~TRINITY_DN9555_c0_g2_i3.p1  ORF type:complete len:411 (+),score=26.62 TRINITY_DN9555_c0_g2_i3:3-1235(+)